MKLTQIRCGCVSAKFNPHAKTQNSRIRGLLGEHCDFATAQRRQPACPRRKNIRKNRLNEFSFHGGGLSNAMTVKRSNKI
jgi:hypothetical protein